MNKLFVILVAIYSLSLQDSLAQPPNIKFEHITLEDGLSQSSIFSIVQDNKGFIWFATLDGLNKYDGYGITIYRNNPADSNSISDNVLNFLYVDDVENGGNLWIGTRGAGLCEFDETFDIFKSYYSEKENTKTISSNNVHAIWGNKDYLWVGTSNGLNRLNRKSGEFSRFYLGDKKNKDQNIINSIVSSRHDTLWLATDNGLCLFDITNGAYKFFTFLLPNKSQTGINKINALHTDKSDNLWLGTDNGLIRFNVDSKAYKIFQYKKSELSRFVHNKINSIIIDKDNIIWAATEKSGLYRLDPATNEFSAYKNDASVRSSLQSNNLLSLYQDKSDILWIGSSLGGVDKWNRAADELSLFRHNPYDENSLSSNQVRNIYEDNQGRIWIGTVQGGLNLWLKKDNKFKHYLNSPNKPNSISHNHVRAILEDKKGRFWIGTDGGGLNRFYPKTGKFKAYKTDNSGKTSDADGPGSNRIWRIIEAKNGNIWLATYGGGLNIFNPETGKFQIYKNTTDKHSLSNNNVTTVFEDHSGIIWVGTFGGGLNRWDEKTKNFIRFEHDPKNKKTIGTNRVYAINEDSKGRLWIGQKGALSLYNRDSNDFTNYDEKDNFPNNVIMGILEDRQGNIWVSTNSGLSKFNPATKKVRNYDIRDGLQSNEFLVGSFCKTKEGMLMFGGINGFNSFDPDKMVDNTNLPSVVITGFQISNQTVGFDTTISNKKLIVLNHKQNDISFDFVALDYIFPEKNQYKYKLVGYDKNWVDIKFKRYATYTNLSPGNYLFKVIGSNNDEVWNTKGTQISVIIEPALWQKLWFRILAAALLISMVLTWFYLRIRRIKQQNEYLEEQVRLRTAELREQQREIMDSIVYAKRIQTAALPIEKNYAKEIISDHFVLFKPKDIVSGDFYWLGQKNGKTIIIAADCTGHGVPGAFMSMLGISFLNKIVNEKGITEPDEILNNLRKNVIYALHQTGAENESKDGMDITVCTILHDKMKLQFAGANNPLYFIREGQMQVIKGDKMPVAYYDFMQPFKLHELDIKKQDVFYQFSDGYADQFGGPKGKKFMYKPFRRLLSAISEKPMDEQKIILDSKIEEWRGDIEQVDDIVVMGVRL